MDRSSPAKPCLLLIEDDQRLLFAMTEVLTAAGYETRIAADGQIAIETLLSGYAPDVVVLDLRMPHVGGLEVLNWLQQHSIRVPIVLATQEDDVAAADVGAVVKLVKPFTLEQLLEAISMALQSMQQG